MILCLLLDGNRSLYFLLISFNKITLIQVGFPMVKAPLKFLINMRWSYFMFLRPLTFPGLTFAMNYELKNEKNHTALGPERHLSYTVFTSLSIHANMQTHSNAHTHTHTFIYIYTYIYINPNTQIHSLIHIYIYIYTHTHTHTRTYIYIYNHEYIWIQTHAHINTNTHTYIYNANI